MALAQTTGTRSLQEYEFLKALMASKNQAQFMAEAVGSLTGEALFKLVADLDAVAAKKQNATWRMEHTDSYCTARDFRYGQRSRRWLQARGLRSKFDQAYALWRVFVQENLLTNPNVKALLAKDANSLAAMPFSSVLKV